MWAFFIIRNNMLKMIMALMFLHWQYCIEYQSINVYRWEGSGFSTGTQSFSSISMCSLTDHYEITDVLLKVTLGFNILKSKPCFIVNTHYHINIEMCLYYKYNTWHFGPNIFKCVFRPRSSTSLNQHLVFGYTNRIC
jgi:hypothetical protein